MNAAHSNVSLGLKVRTIDTCQPPITPSLRERAVALIVDRFQQSEKPDLGGLSFFRAPIVGTGGATHNTAQSTIL